MNTSLYVHFPWCLRKCPYCDFASSGIEPEAIPQTAYTNAVLAELQGQAWSGRNLVSVFIGGGTPSLWEPGELGRLLDAVAEQSARPLADIEVTLEANPTSLTPERARQYVEAGINRFSVGVQSLDDHELGYLGRWHSANEALAILAEVNELPVRLSADLMFGVPDSSVDHFLDHLGKLTGRGLRHISAYALTIEQGTQFGQLHRAGKLRIASEDVYAECFLATHEYLVGLGFDHYEVSNYAAKDARSEHNEHYWRGGDYLGLGAGAVGCLSEGSIAERYRNDPRPAAYMNGAPPLERETLDGNTRVREALMLGLRTRVGVDLQQLARRTGKDPRQGRRDAIDRLGAAGKLIVENEQMHVPFEHWIWLDSILLALF